MFSPPASSATEDRPRAFPEAGTDPSTTAGPGRGDSTRSRPQSGLHRTWACASILCEAERVRGARVRRYGFHPRQCEIEKLSGGQQVAARISDETARVAGAREIAVDEPCKKAVGPVAMRALGGIEFLHIAPHPRAILEHGDLVPNDDFIGDVGDVLGVVQESHRVVIAPEQQNLTVQLEETVERRAAAERITPRLLRNQILRTPAPGYEPGDVLVND